MFKTTVTRLFIGSLIAFGAGAIVSIFAIALAIANNVFVMDGNDIAAIEGGAFAGVLLGVALLGGLAAVGGVIAGFIAWIGAVLNTWQLESKAWFVVLVLTGIFNFGFIAMVIYVIAGPDGKAAATSRTAPGSPLESDTTLAPDSAGASDRLGPLGTTNGDAPWRTHNVDSNRTP